jgi:hypothetical protein
MSLYEEFMAAMAALEDNAHIFGYECEEPECGAKGIATVPIGKQIEHCPVCGS